MVLHNPFHYCFLVLYHDKGANLKLPKIKLLGSFSFPCAPTVTLLNDATRFQTELISQGRKYPEQGRVWLIYGSNVHDSMYGLLGSLVPVIPTKELIETTLMARKSRSVHALIFSLHKHTQRYYLRVISR